MVVRRKRFRLLSALDPKLALALLAAAGGYLKSHGEVRQGGEASGAQYAVMATISGALQLQIDSLKVSVREARAETMRLRRGFRKGRTVTVVDTVRVVEKPTPGIARRLLSALWSPFRRSHP